MESEEQLTVVATTKLPETTYRPPGCKTKENHSLRNSTEQSRNGGTKRWSGHGKERRETMGRRGHANEKHNGGCRKGKEHKLKKIRAWGKDGCS